MALWVKHCGHGRINRGKERVTDATVPPPAIWLQQTRRVQEEGEFRAIKIYRAKRCVRILLILL